MTENGVRLKYLIGDDFFIITDVLTGNTLSYKKGSFVLTTLDPGIVAKEISTLIECISTVTDVNKWFLRRMPHKDDFLRIEHVKHFEWKIEQKGFDYALTSTMATHSRKFEQDIMCSRLNFVYSILLQYGDEIRKPVVEVVRRISDAKLLLWVHDGHTVVHTEESAKGMLMFNCLIDGVPYETVQVSPSKDTGKCGLLTLENEFICEFPLDKSILAFYKPVEEMFDE